MNLKYILDKGNGIYEIRKYFNGKLHSFGYYRSLEDAIKVRNVLLEVNFGLPVNPMRNISKYPTGYRVRKFLDNEEVWSSVHKTLEEAQMVRDEMESIEWNIDNMDTTNIKGRFKKSNKIMFEKNTKGNRWENWKEMRKSEKFCNAYIME